jgi:hypothetical protein
VCFAGISLKIACLSAGGNHFEHFLEHLVFSYDFTSQFLMLLEQQVSSCRMRVGVLVVVLNRTSHISLPELTD